jgi:hypothetical protein
MKISLIGTGLGLLGYTIFASLPAIAQCVQSDVSVQYNISGSRQPTQRKNDVTMKSDPKCAGNASITRSVQGNIGGTNPVEQNREVNQVQRGGSGNPSGIDGSTVKTRSQAAIDVNNPTDYYFNP